jgi:hypothetical protein
MQPYTEISNFLDQESYINLKKFLNDKYTPWFYSPHMVKGTTSSSFFSHCFFNEGMPDSPQYSLIFPILNKLKATALLQARANLTLQRSSGFECSWHTDYNLKNLKTAILYFTTCDGYTLLDQEKQYKIEAEENKIVSFPSGIQHKQIGHSNADRRIVLNLNYYDEG